MADAAPPLQFQTCHLASRHHRVNTPFQGHGGGKLEGRQLHHVKEPGSGNSHPSSTTRVSAPGTTAQPPGREQRGLQCCQPSPSPGLERLHQHNKTRGSRWPSLSALPAVPGPRELKASSPVTAAHGGEAKTGRGGRRNASLGRNQTPGREGRRAQTEPRAGIRGEP